MLHMSLCGFNVRLLGRFPGAALLRQVVDFFRNYQIAFENGCPFMSPPAVPKTLVPPQCPSPVHVCECWHVPWHVYGSHMTALRVSPHLPLRFGKSSYCTVF